MRQSIAIFSVLASAALAADVVSFVFPGGYDGVAPVATIEAANPSTTSALMTCPTGTPADDCGWGTGLDVTIIGGTRYEAVMSAASVYVSYGCDYDSVAIEMTCTAEMTDEDPQTAVLSGTDVVFVTAVVVKGAELLSGGSATASTASVTNSISSTHSGMQTSVASSSGTAAARSSASGSATPTASGSTPENTGAAARFGIEGTALLALAGAAALNVL